MPTAQIDQWRTFFLAGVGDMHAPVFEPALIFRIDRGRDLTFEYDAILRFVDIR